MGHSHVVALITVIALLFPFTAAEIGTNCESASTCSPAFDVVSLLQVSLEDGSESRSSLLADAEQVLVLTLNSTVAERRITRLKSELGPLLPKLQPIVGLDFTQFGNEDELMGAQPFALPDGARQWWHYHQPDRKPSGALGCAMGHRYMWTKAANLTGNGRAWTLILEDDARLVKDPTHAQNQSSLRVVPNDTHLVFLDNHCIDFDNKVPTHGGFIVSGHQTNVFARWSSAYAVTPEGAKALLTVPFKLNSDHLLNAAVKCYGLKAFCPSRPLFENVYPHESLIHPAQAETNLISAIQTEDLTCEALLMT
jgi:hypothetical protein